MRSILGRLAFPAAITTVMSGCILGGTGGAGTGSGGGNSGGAGSGTGMSTSTGDQGGAGAKGWTIVPLIDNDADPSNVVYHKGGDRVTGITFTSLDDGWVTTARDQQSDAGAIFKAKQKEVTAVLFDGVDGGPTLLGTIDFLGLEPTSDGFIALAYASDVVFSNDGGKSFQIQADGAGDPFGIEAVLGFRQRSGGFTMVRDTGVVSVTSQTPGPNAVWDDTWAPTGVPPTPDPVPADQCQRGPESPLPMRRDVVHVSTDGALVAYASNEDAGAAICVSHDGGKSFFPSTLPGLGADAAGYQPAGIHFTDAMNGIAWWGNYIYPGEAYVEHTTDGGATWTKVELPADVAQKGIEMNGAFFAPDGENGWIVGYDDDNEIALLLKTTDGGATWASSGGDLAAKVSDAGGGKLYAGFALDANHIWVGGQYGILAANDAGGE